MEPSGDGRVQNVVVMRHGDRIDNEQPMWATHAQRPWDPPLFDSGVERAWATGKKLRLALGFHIHRVLVSPFLRCLQTASEVVRALCAPDPAALKLAETSRDVEFDPSRVKVSIEYGLSEVMGREAIDPKLAPVDGKWFPDISQLEALLPPETIDGSAGQLYERIPEWGESMLFARTRYEEVILALADKFPNENLLLITHGECVGASVSNFLRGMLVYEVDNCAFTHLQRQVVSTSKSSKPEDFKVFTYNGQTGVLYTPLFGNKWL